MWSQNPCSRQNCLKKPNFLQNVRTWWQTIHDDDDDYDDDISIYGPASICPSKAINIPNLKISQSPLMGEVYHSICGPASICPSKAIDIPNLKISQCPSMGEVYNYICYIWTWCHQWCGQKYCALTTMMPDDDDTAAWSHKLRLTFGQINQKDRPPLDLTLGRRHSLFFVYRYAGPF